MPRVPSGDCELDMAAEDEQRPTTTRSNRPAVGKCVVCSAPAYCFHFGVLTCRACAAFFRRSVVLGRSYPCRGKRKCVIVKEEQVMCRHCRYNKCLKVGMQDDKIRMSTDSESSAMQEERLATMETSSTDSNSSQDTPKVHPPMLNRDLIAKKSIYDFSSLIERVIRKAFRPPQELPPHLTLLEKMVAGLHYVRRNQSKHPVLMDQLDSVQTQHTFERNFLTAADWLMHIPAFVALDLSEKYVVYKNAKFCFARLERFHVTGLIYGRAIVEDGRALYVIDDNMTADFCRTRFDASFLSDLDWEDVRRFFSSVRKRLMEDIAMPMVELKVTDMELAFMLCQSTWHLEGRDGVSETLLKLSREQRERAAEELHDYYTRQEPRTHYAPRLQRMLRIVADCEAINRERNSVLELSKFFDVFRVHDEEPPLISAPPATLDGTSNPRDHDFV